MRLRPSIPRNNFEVEEDLDLSNMDEDPLTYFLTPASPYRDDAEDAMDFEMDFDAGIEDSKHPAQVVRSVSPSSLDGFSRPPAPAPHQLPSPPRSPATPDLDFDLSTTPDDHLDVDDAFLQARARHHASFGNTGMPLLLKDFTAEIMMKKNKTGSRARANSAITRSLGPPTPADRGRSKLISKGTPLPGSQRQRLIRQSSRLSPHAWREPSPDVWSIEEEPERERQAVEQMSVDDDDDDVNNTEFMDDESFLAQGWEAARVVPAGGARAIDILAAKPKTNKSRKRVRFVLPEGYNKDLDMY